MKNIVNGLIVTIIYLIVAFIAFSIRYGLSWWTSPENDLLIFFPIWSIIAFYVGYKASAYYYEKKASFYTKEEDLEIANENWKLFKRSSISKLLIIIAKLFAIMTPFYILAYIDGSTIMKSSINLIVIFALVGVVCFVIGKKISVQKD